MSRKKNKVRLNIYVRPEIAKKIANAAHKESKTYGEVVDEKFKDVEVGE